jgi:hypothetical protein
MTGAGVYMDAYSPEKGSYCFLPRERLYVTIRGRSLLCLLRGNKTRPSSLFTLG